MTEYSRGPEREIPEETGETETTRATGMGNPGEFPELEGGNGSGRRNPVDRVRAAAGGKLEDTARRVREIGDRAATRSPVLERARPLANDTAARLDDAARYVRERELEAVRTDLETQVRRHPLTSVALAFLAGYMVRRIF